MKNIMLASCNGIMAVTMLTFVLSFVLPSVWGELRDASVAETQMLLAEWGLHEEFGEAFELRGFDGRALSLLEISDYSKDVFPQATRLHFKMLLDEVQVATSTENSRRLEVKKPPAKKTPQSGSGAKKAPVKTPPDTSDFRSVTIKHDKAMLSFGKKSDVKIIRTGPSELSIWAGKINFYGHVAINGKPVAGGQGGGSTGGSALEKRIAQLEDKIAKMAYNAELGDYNNYLNSLKALEKNLIYYIPFNEGSGTTANVYGSKGGTSSTATLMNGATWDNGKHGSAIKLDGKNDYVNGPAIKGTPTLKDLTACMWVKFDSTNSGGFRQYVIDTQYHKYSLIIDETKSGSAIRMDTYFGSGSKELYSGSQTIQLRSWNYYCNLRRSGTSQNWMDGKLLNQGKGYGGNHGVQPGTWIAGTYNGARKSSGQYFVHGSMCGMRVYDRALDKKEIVSLYNLGPCDGWRPELKAGLVYHLPLDEGKGTTTAVKGSLGGTSSTAKLMNGASWDIGEPHGAALKLDGKNDFVLAPAIKGNLDLGDMTGCVWARFASTHSGGHRQYMLDTKPQTFILLVDEVTRNKAVKVDVWFGPPGKELYSNPVTIKLDAWNHFCGTRRNGASEIYVDGRLVKTGKMNTKKIRPQEWHIGRYTGAGSGQYYTHGLLCGVRVYNRAIHPQEVQMLFNNGVCGKGTKPKPREPGSLIFHLPMDEGKGTKTAVLGSKGGTSSTATLMNGATWDKGKHGTAIKLDGKNDYVHGPAIKGRPALKDMTGCIWAKFASTNSGGHRQYMIDTNPQTYILLVDETSSGKAVKMDTYFGPGSKELYTGSLSIKLHSWNHYCSLREGTTTRHYLDGKLVKEGKNYAGTKTINPAAWIAGTYYGSRTKKGQYFVHGSMCAMRIYDRALKPKEIQFLYKAGTCF